MSAFFVALLLACGIGLWLALGGAYWLARQMVCVVRGIVRAIPDDQMSKLFASAFRNAAEEGLRDRDARRKRP